MERENFSDGGHFTGVLLFLEVNIQVFCSPLLTEKYIDNLALANHRQEKKQNMSLFRNRLHVYSASTVTMDTQTKLTNAKVERKQ